MNIKAQDFRTVHDGVEYAQVIRKLGSDPVKINLLRLDLKKVRLDVHHAMDAAIGTEKTSSIATRHGAIAAINAGFFRLDSSKFAGDSAGVLKIDNELLSESLNDRIAIGIENGKSKTSVMFEHIQYRKAIAYNDISRRIDGVNRQPKPQELVVFTSGLNTPIDEKLHTEIVLEECSNFCKRASVLETHGGLTVPDGGYIIVFGAEADKEYMVNYFERTANQRSNYPTFLFDVAQLHDKPGKLAEKFRKYAEDITNGVSRLIRKGKIDITWEQEKAGKAFAETRHPRTAVAKLKGGKFLMITVDGRQPGVSVGMNLQELAEYLLSLGAVDAMNLDGGGSTTMFLDGKVINTPSDKEGERKIGDAILVTLRKQRK
ncbi:MAG: phosphodiester glycosidase family protein [Acidobacteria bacterium]|nr:phosphodiester glycosidase family protein [Acidobacteriota bacterium]